MKKFALITLLLLTLGFAPESRAASCGGTEGGSGTCGPSLISRHIGPESNWEEILGNMEYLAVFPTIEFGAPKGSDGIYEVPVYYVCKANDVLITTSPVLTFKHLGWEGNHFSTQTISTGAQVLSTSMKYISSVPVSSSNRVITTPVEYSYPQNYRVEVYKKPDQFQGGRNRLDFVKDFHIEPCAF